MRPDVTDADNQRDATFRAQYRSFILPLMITLIGGIPVEVLHQCPHGGEHVFRHALAIRAARIGDHGAARQHTRADVRIHTGAEGLQPFKTGVLSGLRDREVADDCGSLGTKLLGTAADHTMSPRCASTPTNSCGTSRAALAKARRSPSLRGRQLTISLCVFSIPMVHQTRRQGRYYRGFLMLNQCRTATGPMPNPPPSNPHQTKGQPIAHRP